MAVHIWNRKHIHPLTAAKMVANYWRVRGELSHKESKQWAVWTIERFMQSTHHCIYYDQARYGYKNYDQSMFTRLLRTARFGPYPYQLMKGLSNVSIPHDLNRNRTYRTYIMECWKHHNEVQWCRFNKGLDNVNNVLDETGYKIDNMFVNSDTDLKQWLVITRGRKLFIKGMGKFDISNATVDAQTYLTLSVSHIQACGYSPGNNYYPRELISLLTTHRRADILNHLKKNWFGYYLRNFNRLDELRRYVDRKGARIELSECPVALLQRLEDYEETQHKARDSRAYIEYEHIKDSQVVATASGRKLSAIRNSKELEAVADSLHNCAGVYSNTINQGKSVLVKLVEDEKVVALGELTRQTRGKSKQVQWNQIVGSCNKPVDHATMEEYKAKTSTFAKYLL